MTTAKAKVEKKPEEKFVTLDRFEALESGVNRILDMMEKNSAPQSELNKPIETPLEAEVRKAGANQIPMNPEWDELAKTIIGEAVDHCEIQYVKNGGVLFTVVIKEEFSNSSKDYLERYKQDRRTKEVGSEGIEGVENWCKLIKSNLSKGKPLARR